MKWASISVAVLVLMTASGVRPSFGQTPYVYTTNLLAAADTTVLSANPGDDLGGAPYVYAGVDTSGTYRGLFRFDVSAIPANATVTNVTLALILLSGPAANALFGLNVLFTNWDETANWNNRAGSAPWTAPGGLAGTDLAAVASAQTLISGSFGTTIQFTDDGSNPSFGLVHDVQTWINQPARNFGWMLAAVDESSTDSLCAVWSREFPDYQPVLTVGYTQPFSPPTLGNVSAVNGVFQFSFKTEPNHGYGVQRIDDLAGTNWVNIGVFDPYPYPADVTFSYPMTASNRFFRVITSNY